MLTDDLDRPLLKFLIKMELEEGSLVAGGKALPAGHQSAAGLNPGGWGALDP